MHSHATHFFRDFERWAHEVEDAIQGSPFFKPRDARFPRLDVYSSEEKVMVMAEIPGAMMDDLDIQVRDGQLIISGKVPSVDDPDGFKLIRRERRHGEFTRNIPLPYAVDVEKVNAKYSKGVLEVTLPRAEQDRPRKVVIHTEE